MDVKDAAPKKTRGRPKGTGTDDSLALAKVADRLVACPAMRASTAMRRDCPTIETTLLRRLQRKWKTEKSTLIAEASKRLEESRKREEAARRSVYNPVSLVPDYERVANLLGLGRIPPAMLGYELANKHGLAALISLPLVGAGQANPAWMTGLGALYPHGESPFAKQAEWLSKATGSHKFGAGGPFAGSLAKHLEWLGKSTHGEALGIGIAGREIEATLRTLDSLLAPLGVRRHRS